MAPLFLRGGLEEILKRRFYFDASLLLDDDGMIHSIVNFVRDKVRSPAPAPEGSLMSFLSVGYGFKAIKSVCT